MEELLLDVVLKAFAILAEAFLVHLLRAWFAQPDGAAGTTHRGVLLGLGA